MASPPKRPWTVLPHEPLRALDDGLFTLSGPIPGLSMPLPRTMTVVRRADGTLLVHGAIAADGTAMRALEAAGEPRALVVANPWHRLDAFAWKERYPKLRVYCPAGAVRSVSEVVPVDGTLDALPVDEVVRAETLDGMDREGVLVVRGADGTTLVFGDTFMNAADMPGVFGFAYKAVGASGGPRVHPFMKWMANKKRLVAHLARLAELDGLVRLVPSHGEVIEERAAAVLREAVARA